MTRCDTKEAPPVDTKHRLATSRVAASAEADPLWQSAWVRSALTPAAVFFGAGAYCRLLAYGSGMLQRKRAAAPVISIGNITVGGTGKTPVTISIAASLIEKGRKVAILSRGYGRRRSDSLTVVSDGAGRLSSLDEAGDEPYLIARALPEAVVIAGKDRTTTAELAVGRFRCDCIILDDGFQHLRLKREHDVVLIDYNDDLTRERLLPAGRLREPLVALSRASHVVITKVPAQCQQDRLTYLESLVKEYAPDCQLSFCRFAADLDAIRFGSRLPVSSKVVAVCGIARPEQFRRTLASLPLDIAAFHAFADHRDYTQADLQILRDSLESTGAACLVTTEKDYFKISRDAQLAKRTSAIPLAIEWIGARPLFHC